MARGRRRFRTWSTVGAAAVAAAAAMTSSPIPQARAADPPEYHAVAHGLVSGVQYLSVMNGSGVAVGGLDGGGLARVEGATATRLTSGFANPSAVSETGTIVGYRPVAPDGNEAFRIDGTTLTVLPGLGRQHEIAYDIDPSGTLIVGSSTDATGDQAAWIDDGTTVTGLPDLGGDYALAVQVNPSGLVGGSARDPAGVMHLVTWQDGAITDHGTLGGDNAFMVAINDSGQFLASVLVPGVGSRGRFWDGSTMHDLGTFGGDTGPGGLNALGQVTATSWDGEGHARAAVWDGTSLVDLGTLGGTDAFAGGINDHGRIVGSSTTAAGEQHGFLVDDGVMYDLNDLVPPDSVEIRNAHLISNSGHIAADSEAGAVLLVPGPRPEAAYTVIDLGAGLPASSEVEVLDLNSNGMATGSIDRRAFRFDGAASAFLFTDLGRSSGNAITDDGTIAGVGPNGTRSEAFVDDGTVRFLGTLGGSQSWAADLNGAGDVVGWALTSSEAPHAFLVRDGSMIDLHDLGGVSSDARAINEAGTVIGTYSPTNGQFRGFVSDGTTTTDLGTLGGGFTSPAAINGTGVVTGTSSTVSQPNVAFRWANGVMSNVAPPGSSSSEGRAINDAGMIAGSYLEPSGDRRAFRYDGASWTLIPAIGGGFATAIDINAGGDVVGVSTTDAGALRGYLFDGTLVDLSTRLPLGYKANVEVAFRIADDGTILARGTMGNHRQVAMLLIPAAGDPVAPGAPTGVTAAKGDARATVTWTPPADDGGSPITASTVTSSPGGLTATVDGSTTTAVVTGLTNGTAYTFTVIATNAIGSGPPSDPSNVVTPGAPVAQTITFPRPPNATLAQSPLAVTATASSGLPVTLTSSTPTVCSPTGLSIALLAAGSCTLTASQAGNADFRPAPPITRTFTVTKAAQTIAFPRPPNSTMLASPLAVTASATSGLPVTLTASTPAVCRIDGLTVTLLAPGTCTITATQPGDAIWDPAPTVTRSFTVSKAAQTITFPRPANTTLLGSPVTVTATASSGLPVTLTSTTPTVCTVRGFTIDLLTAGTCRITATQAGDSVYNAAAAVARTFSVTQVAQQITIPDPGPQSMLVPTVVLSPWATSGLPVTLATQTGAVCTVSGDVVTLRRAGTCRIRGTQPGNATYLAAPGITRQFTITASTALPFVTATGDGLTVGGQPYRFHGASIYGTSNPGAPNAAGRTVALAVEGGLDSLRIVNVFDERGLDATAPFVEAEWQRVDGLLARARGAGMRVVLDLSAFRNHLVNRDIRAHGWEVACQPGADRSPVDYAAIDPYRAALAGEWEAFLDFVVDRVNTVNGVRYGDDATIAVISIAGEPLPPASAECGKATTTQGLTDFYARTLGYLASIDPNHLRSTGGLIHLDWEQLFGGGSSGIDGEAIFALAANTLPALHTYPSRFEPDGTPIDYQTPVYGPLATDLGKPWFTEEFGWPQEVGDATRASRYAWLYEQQAANGSDGAMFWNLGLEVAGGSHDANPSTPLTWAEILAR